MFLSFLKPRRNRTSRMVKQSAVNPALCEKRTLDALNDGCGIAYHA